MRLSLLRPDVDVTVLKKMAWLGKARWVLMVSGVLWLCAIDPDTFSMRDSDFNRQPIGVGPFMFKEWKSDELIRLVRHNDYWEGPPAYKEYVYRILPDPVGQELSFYAGTVDIYNAQAHQVARLQDNPQYQHFSGLSLGYTYIGYNLRREPFKDPRVRRALGMAINVDEMIDRLDDAPHHAETASDSVADARYDVGH